MGELARLSGRGRVGLGGGAHPMTHHWRTGETAGGPVRIEATGDDAYRVYAGQHPGGDPVGSFCVERVAQGFPIWIWAAGGPSLLDQGTAESEDEALLAILRAVETA
jgi:hypothetical protein